MPAPHLVTYEEFAAVPDDGRRYEVLGGTLVVRPTPGSRHQTILGNLLVELIGALDHRRLGQAILGPIDVVLSPHDVLEPDLVVVFPDRYDVVTVENLQGAPHLVVEILAPGTYHRDRIVKRAIYERFGVEEFWAVDSKGIGVTIYRRQSDRLVRALRLKRVQDMLSTPLLPGIALPLARIFHDPWAALR